MDLTQTEVRKLLKDACRLAGSQHRWSDRHGFSAAFVSDVLNGRKDPTEKLCRALNLRRLTVYRTVESRQ